MTKTYSQLMKQIEGLKTEAEKLRRKEVDGVIARIREAIDHYALTAADLGLGLSSPAAVAGKKTNKAKAKAGNAAVQVAAPKFRNEAGQAWGGRGPRPKWLRDALATGRTLGEFAVG